ncbi:MAG: NAD(P)H-hydrate epimerase, partial [Verrucomicrobiota bacterium]|nr:NAD(P)H-hydrate epimerase [Verrucomicrobiota bacterium]
MRELEEQAFRAGVSAEALMDRAGRRLGEALRRLCPEPGTAVAYLGRGNNGGDALVALQVLRAAGWNIVVRCPFQPLELSLLSRRKLRELGEVELQADALDPSDHPAPLLLIDGLLGLGAQGPLRDPLRALAAEMNELRACAGARVVAVDIPSGLNGDTGEPGEGGVQADLTATIGIPKRGLVADGALNHVGRIEVIPLEELPVPADGDRLTTSQNLRALLPPRDFETHKGQAGRVGIVGGSRGMFGAAGLAALGALRGGAGLVTVYVLERDYPLLLAAAPPEAMVRPVTSYAEVADVEQDVLVLGPGLGRHEGGEESALLDLLGRNDIPLVVDADALNLLAA